jgi:hypothetical protein
MIAHDPELLLGLSEEELEALAEGLLFPSAQGRFNALLKLNAEGPLGEAERVELDRLLEQVDQLTILRTRARFTLKRHAETA